MSDMGGTSDRRRRTILPIVAVLLAAIAGGVLVWSIKGHRESTPAIPIALVNQDQPVTTGSGSTQKTVAAGRLLAANLSQPSAANQTPLSWQLMDATDADAGLHNGTYYGILTIPPGFSAAITSTSGASPQQAQLVLVTDQTASAAVSELATATVDQAAATLGQQVTSSFVDNILQSMTSIHTSLTSSASSAQTIASSSQQLASSSHQLADSAGQLSSGAASANDGAASLASGSATLASGASQAAAGAAQVSQGATSLATAAGQLSQGAQSAASGASSLASSAQKVSTGAGLLARQTGELHDGIVKVDNGAGTLADTSEGISDRAQSLAADCPADVSRVYCDRVALLSRELSAQADATRILRVGTAVEARRSEVVDTAAGALATADAQVAGGAAQLSTGVAQVSTGAGSLSSGAATLASGAKGVATGTSSVATGAAQTSSGAASLSQGTAQLASGSAQLASGASQLAGGADQLASGNQQLATGLTNGAQQVPSYTDDQRSQLVSVVTTPVDVAGEVDTLASVVASLMPAVLALILWLGTLMMFLTRTAVPTGAAWSQASAVRRVLFGLLPALLVGLVQAAALILLVALSGVPVHSPLGLMGVAALGVLAFAATNQALVAAFGTIGRLVSVAFVAVEAAALSGLVPIETAPAALQTLNDMLPLPQLASGLRQVLLGGGGDLATASLVLVGWTAIPLLVSVVATARRRPQLAPALRPPATPATPAREPVLAGDPA